MGWNIFRVLPQKILISQKKTVWLNLPIQCIDLSVESATTACYLHICRKLWYSVYFENENVITMWKCIWKRNPKMPLSKYRRSLYKKTNNDHARENIKNTYIKRLMKYYIQYVFDITILHPRHPIQTAPNSTLWEMISTTLSWIIFPWKLHQMLGIWGRTIIWNLWLQKWIVSVFNHPRGTNFRGLHP